MQYFKILNDIQKWNEYSGIITQFFSPRKSSTHISIWFSYSLKHRTYWENLSIVFIKFVLLLFGYFHDSLYSSSLWILYRTWYIIILKVIIFFWIFKIVFPTCKFTVWNFSPVCWPLASRSILMSLILTQLLSQKSIR